MHTYFLDLPLGMILMPLNFTLDCQSLHQTQMYSIYSSYGSKALGHVIDEQGANGRHAAIRVYLDLCIIDCHYCVSKRQ